jgi:hypothetical protein
MEVLESMLQHHESWDPVAEKKFVDSVFGVAKKSTSKPTKTHEVSRVRKSLSNKRRCVDFYNLTGLLDYYEETHFILSDDLNEYHNTIRTHLRTNNYQEGDILFLGSVHKEQQELSGFGMVIKTKGSKNFKLGEHPEILLSSKKSYYCQAVEAMNALWNDMFGCDVISDETISTLSVNDMYDD